jgi:metal-responsive CopG/Arc/MetJ family transcriptional regulator
MDLHTPTEQVPAAAPTRLEPVLVRLPPTLAQQLRQLARSTRIRQSDYLREAVADLIAKYRNLQPRPEQAP